MYKIEPTRNRINEQIIDPQNHHYIHMANSNLLLQLHLKSQEIKEPTLFQTTTFEDGRTKLNKLM